VFRPQQRARGRERHRERGASADGAAGAEVGGDGALAAAGIAPTQHGAFRAQTVAVGQRHRVRFAGADLSKDIAGRRNDTLIELRPSEADDASDIGCGAARIVGDRKSELRASSNG
jgi:hypothetical protein